MSMETKRVLVAGVQGVIGRAAAERFAHLQQTKVLGLSRRPGDLVDVEHISVDLLSPTDVRSKLANLTDITHVVFAPYIEKPTAAQRSSVNVALLENLLDVIEPASPSLRHIAFYQGGKAYGADLGPFKTPAREDDPRLMPPNFYYDQEDTLRRRQQGKAWNFTALRPEAVCGYAIGNPMNLTMVIAIYAALSKELGLPLRFPGSMSAYRALYQVTSADILAAAADWAGNEPRAANEIFNITNGDYFRWEHMWPRIARMFDMEVGYPVPLPLAEYMADKAPLWETMIQKYGLKNVKYEDIVSWPFGDFIFNSEFDNISSTIKARQAGFHDCIDTEEMFRQFFSSLKARRIIPV
ncbi:SDR family oxidoreductase [Acidisoma sp. S159]|jgi:nucleoside-diphosphate-sugar epimerase|uniref:SDR family oxidoreductase n=2 Tax=unclassified Acidisoma TaxID=2634065 RepID=UPI00157517A2|nr:SDR family oxidoreductase [Acidisoma sp. S159]